MIFPFASLRAPELVDVLAQTLLHFLWQGTLIAALLGFVHRLMSHQSAQQRYLAGCLALVAMVAAPVCTFQRLLPTSPKIVKQVVILTSPVAGESALSTASAFGPRLIREPSLPPSPPDLLQTLQRDGAANWRLWLVGIWLCGVCACSARLAWGCSQLQVLRHRDTHTVSRSFEIMVRRLGKQLGLRRHISVRYSSRISGPIAFGFLKLVILLPLSLSTRLSPREWEMILAHELAHLRRHDFLVNLLQSAVESVFFFHPAIWWVNARIRREREHACDDMALRVTRDARGYAHILVSVAEWQTTEPPALTLAAARPARDLQRRISRILAPPNQAGSLLRPLPGFAVIAFIILTLLAPAAPPLTQAQVPLDTNPVRGNITDRNGVVLATDGRPDRQIVFDLREVVKVWQAVHGEKLPMETVLSTPESTQVDVARIFDEIAVQTLDQAGLAADYNRARMKVQYRNSPHLPWTYRTSLDADTYAKAGALASRPPGMSVRTVNLRLYPYQALAGHLLGYVRRQSPSGDPPIGVAGAEETWNAALTPLPARAGSPAARGADVQLTLDIRHQFVVEQTLRKSGVGRGTAVLMDTATGSVLAMASLPSYDPNDFIPAITKEQFEAYTTDPSPPCSIAH